MVSFSAFSQNTYSKVQGKQDTFVLNGGKQSSGYTLTQYKIVIKGKEYRVFSHIPSRGKNKDKLCYYAERTSQKTGKVYYQFLEGFNPNK